MKACKFVSCGKETVCKGRTPCKKVIEVLNELKDIREKNNYSLEKAIEIKENNQN